MHSWMLFGGGYELWRELYERFNVIPFLGGNFGVQMAGWFNREINTIEDYKGLKMRIPGLGGKVVNRVGGTSILSPERVSCKQISKEVSLMQQNG